MESIMVFSGLNPSLKHMLRPSRSTLMPVPSVLTDTTLSPPSFLKLRKQHHCLSRSKANTVARVVSPTSTETYGLAELDWDNLGFSYIPTDYMYSMKCIQGQEFSEGELKRFGNIELSPSAGVLNYGQGLFEGMKAYRKQDGSIVLFRPEENALRMRIGAERMWLCACLLQQLNNL